MKKIFVIALLVLCFAVPVFATGITWFGSIGLGTDQDDAGFIVFKDKAGQYTYIWMDSDYQTATGKGDVIHSFMIAHSYALYSAHSPDTEAGYFGLRKKGVQLFNNINKDVKPY